MRLDYVTIFPDYFAPLALSLPGKAQQRGLLAVEVHDLRQWAHDRHHTVDDSPAGGGAGMVMKPEPWGAALDALLGGQDAGDGEDGGEDTAGTTLVVPTPSGAPFTQAQARALAGRQRLIFACGRYEGIDQRVLDHAATRVEVQEISLGDYVLNGGEVAALAVTEAVVRLLPGFMGNPESLVEESHEDGLLEAPAYTKPARWRDLDVPPVLLSGDHGRIATWRHDQAVRRTAQRRPDLVAPASVPGGGDLRVAAPSDAGELFTLQLACWVAEGLDNPGVTIPAQHERLADVEAWVGLGTVLVLRRAGRLIGAVRGRLEGATWDIGRLMVAPDLQGQGLGRILLAEIESRAPEAATTLSLFTGAGSDRNIRMYQKAGYRLGRTPPVGAAPVPHGAVLLTKPIRRDSP